MNMLEQLFSSGAIALIAAVFLIIETLVLVFVLRQHVRIFPILWNSLSGIGLLGALYAALSGAGWMTCAVFLTLGLFGHLGDLIHRLRHSQTVAPQERNS